MKVNPNLPAFARPMGYNPDGLWNNSQTGLTIREYIATQSMVGLCVDHHSGGPIGNARRAVEFADALITELNKEAKSEV
jgi:hypothetical protein